MNALNRLMAYDDNMARVFRAARTELGGNSIEQVVNAKDRERPVNAQNKGDNVSGNNGVYYISTKMKSKKNPLYKKSQDPTAEQSERARLSNKVRAGTSEKTIQAPSVGIMIIATGAAFETPSVMTISAALKKKKEAGANQFSMTADERNIVESIKPRKVTTNNRVVYQGGDALKLLVDENTQIQLLSEKRSEAKKAAEKLRKRK